MTSEGFERFLNDLAKEVVKKPISHRLKTRALGDDPAPIIEFELTDIGIFSLDLTRDEAPFIKKGRRADSNLRIVTNSNVFFAIWTGQLVAWKAMQRLELQIFGSMRLAHALQRYFNADLDLSEFAQLKE